MTDNKFENELLGRKVIDNRTVSMTETLKYLLNKEEFRILDVAVGYFYISGLLLLKNEFTNFMDNRNGHFRILMGNETNGATVNVLDSGKYQNYAELIKASTEKDTNNISDKEFLGKVAEWIKEGRIEVKVYTGTANYFHAKSYLFASSLNTGYGTAIVGSSNFSKSGLEGNTELNVLTQDGFFALHHWYNDLWLSKDEVTDFAPDLIKIANDNGAKKTLQQYKPVKETYYDFANIFAQPYAQLDTSKEWVKELFPHQRSGIVATKEKLDSLNTAVLSDGVGLGKTRTAAGVIRLYLETQNINRILIIADNKLKDQWHDELNAVGIKEHEYEYISRQQLVNMSDDQIKANNNYTLIIIDEAHLGFKNNNTEAYKKVLFMKQNNPKVKGLLLTATPWNNAREDVINIGSLFLNVNGIPNDRKYKQYFLLSPNKLTNKVVKHLANDDAAFKEFWSDIYLQRTRKTYGGKGTRFPHRNFPSVDIPYEPRKNEIFSNNFDVISDLKFPYQDPIKYVDDSKEELGAKQLKMMLLKRADSSWKAYVTSLQHIVDKLEKLNELYLKRMSYLKGKDLLGHYRSFLSTAYGVLEYENNVNILFKDFELSTPEDTSQQTVKSQLRKQRYIENLKAQIDGLTVKNAKNAIEKMIADYNSDLSTLKMLIESLNKAYSKVDEKVDEIIKCIDEEHSKGHKIILVSQFADTVEYYYDKLYSHYNKYQLKYPMGMITGAANAIGEDGASAKINQAPSTKKEVLKHFSPRSKKAIELIENNEQIDLVVATDTISTGQNLQDAVTLMNIDLPYNPMTLEQRIGRIDRPLPEGDNNDQIYIYTFPIYQSINSQLKMMNRLGSKMAGVLNDTEFDNVVLPQYEEYLKDIKEKKQNAVKAMLDKTDDQLINHSDFSSEKHSEAYQQANKRMYDFKANQFTPLKNPLIPDYSFSNGKDKSIAVVEIQYYDVNGSFLEKENILVDIDAAKKIKIIEAEENLNGEIGFDIHNSNVLPEEKALAAIEKAKGQIYPVIKQQVAKYNKQHEFFAKNIDSTKNKTSVKAAVALRTSASQDPKMVMSKLQSVKVDPKRLKDITQYVETIDKDDDLFPIVKEIAANPNVFWLEIKNYIKFFNPDNLQEMENVGKDIQKASTRKADLEKTRYRVLNGNIVIK